MKHSPAIAFASPNEIRNFQLEKLAALLSYVWDHSAFYRSHFQKNKIPIASITSLEDYTKVPVTTKNDLQASNWDFLCVDRSQIAEYTSTSGTLGKPVTIALTINDINRLAYNEATSFACADGSAADLYQLMLTLDRQFMAGIAYYEGIRKLGAGLVRVGPGLPAMQWETIERLRPNAIVAVPSFVVKLLEYAIANGIDVNKSSVKKVICIGESIRDSNFHPNALAQKITDAWNVKLYSTYASTEMQTAFTECFYGKGGHHHPELLIVELLDDNNTPVANNEIGEITITTLGVEGMPLLRYKTGDMAQLHSDKCDCGRTTSRIGPIVGRRQQMLKLKGTTVYPPAIFGIVNQQPEILDYLVEALTGSLGTDELRVYAIVEPQAQALVSSQLAAKFQSALRVVPEVIFTDRQYLESLNGLHKERKIKKFIDSRT